MLINLCAKTCMLVKRKKSHKLCVWWYFPNQHISRAPLPAIANDLYCDLSILGMLSINLLAMLYACLTYVCCISIADYI